MAAVVRVKRALDEEPSEALLLSCKRRKIDSNAENALPELSKLAEFAGTAKNQEDDIRTYLKKSTKNTLEEQFKKRNIDINAKLRDQRHQEVRDSRFKIVKSFRTGDQPDIETKSDLIIYDIETESASKEGQEDNFVFDLYIADNFGGTEDYDISVHALSDELIQDLRCNGFNDSDSEDSEDSNAENFWTHDYPDESDMDSVGEDDMITAVNRLDLSDALSSDDEDEGGSCPRADRNGHLYERYKARMELHEGHKDTDAYLDYGDTDDEDDC